MGLKETYKEELIKITNDILNREAQLYEINESLNDLKTKYNFLNELINKLYDSQDSDAIKHKDMQTQKADI